MAEDETPAAGDPQTQEPEPIPGPTRTFDPGALLVGLWFMIAGFVGATFGDHRLDDLPPIVIPVSFAVLGLGLLIPKRTVPR